MTALTNLNQAKIKLSEDASCLKINGTLNVETVVTLRELGTRLAQNLVEPVYDLQGVTHCDSSALALLTAWARDAKKTGKQARFIHVPTQLMAIAQLSGMDNILALRVIKT